MLALGTVGRPASHHRAKVVPPVGFEQPAAEPQRLLVGLLGSGPRGTVKHFLDCAEGGLVQGQLRSESRIGSRCSPIRLNTHELRRKPALDNCDVKL